MRRFRRCAPIRGTATKLPIHSIPSFIESCLVSARAALPASAAVEQMANDMRDAEARGGGITGDELELLGFTPEQVSTLASRARMRAQKLAGATA